MVKLLLSFICVKYVIILILFHHGIKVLASLDCNFDDEFGDDFCGWQQDESDDFDWRRHSEHSPSSNTGPDSDHSTGENGHYIYIEATDQKMGDKARLRSPVQKPGPSCLIFWYNMYGEDIGTHNVYIELNGGSETLLFRRDENVDNQDWRKAIINSNANNTYQIVIEGVQGDGYRGDIAVDDISMKHEWCSIDCDFDNGFCDWAQDDRDDFDWQLRKGPTDTNNTGPLSDHTSGNGQYVYIDSSSANRDEKALLVSPVQNAGKYCLSFWYYMYGDDVETLRVLKWNERGTQREVFTKSGNIGQKWVLASLVLRSSAYFKMTFEGSVKNKWWWSLPYNGDIAIDDIQMFSCQDCDNPTPDHAITNSTNFEYGSVIKVTCNTGYDLIGESVLVCKTGGSWSASRPTCELYDCGDLNIPNGMFIAREGTTFGQAGKYVCNIGYYLIGFPAVSCTATGWNSTGTTCEIIDCGDPTPKYALPNSTNFEYGSVVEIECFTGYSLAGEPQMVCQSDGSWSENKPTCEIFDCGNRTLPNGMFNAINGTTFGQTAIHACNIGYTLIGDKNVTCTALGWSGNNSTCETVDADNNALIAVYVSVPVTMVILLTLFTVILFRKGVLSCKSLKEVKDESRKNTVLFPNQTYTTKTPERLNISAHQATDESLQLNNEYEIITSDGNDKTDTAVPIYCNTVVAIEATKKDIDHNYDHARNTTTLFVDESYSHISGREADNPYESRYNTTSNEGNTHLLNQMEDKSYDSLNNCNKITQFQKENEESDYDHAHAGDVAQNTSGQDDYSHLNDMITRREYSAYRDTCLGNDDDVEYSKVNKGIKRKERTFEKSENGYKNPKANASQYIPLEAGNQDTVDPVCNDKRHFMPEAYEANDDSDGSENHNYFVLEKAET